MKINTFKKITAALAVAVLLTGCSGADDGSGYKIKIVTSDISESYALATAQIGDVELYGNISCSYQQLNEEEISFDIAGYSVGHVYVLEGDSVSAGDLLAELDMSDLVSKNISYREQIAESELGIRQQNELISFYRKRIESPTTTLKDKEEYTLAIQACEEKITDYEGTIEYANTKMAVNENLIDRSAIYAGIDGTVSFVRSDISSFVSALNTTVIKIIDTSNCAFTATDLDLVSAVHIGDSITVTVSGSKYYSATITMADLETGRMVFELDEPEFTFSVGQRASVRINLDERKNVLTLPKSTVYGTDEMHYVYTLSDNGVREMKEIEVGLIGNDYVEILGGIEPDDSVILRSKK